MAFKYQFETILNLKIRMEDMKNAELKLAIEKMETEKRKLQKLFSEKESEERLFKESVKSGPAEGAVLNHEKWEAMLDHYYEIHGWDTKTGIPTAETLRACGLEELIADLDRPASVPGRAYY